MVRAGDDCTRCRYNLPNLTIRVASVALDSLEASVLIDVATGAGTSADAEGADPKVVEFLKILEEYRLKCEEEGNYLEAAKASKQVETLRKQEERRQQRAVRAKQVAERQDIQIAHNMQYAEFNAAWDKYMREYDEMAAVRASTIGCRAILLRGCLVGDWLGEPGAWGNRTAGPLYAALLGLT